MKSKWIGAVVIAACVVPATAAFGASAAAPSVVNVAALSGASAAAPSAATAPGSGCSNRAVTSNFHDALGQAGPVPVLPVERCPRTRSACPRGRARSRPTGTYPYTMVGTDPAAGSAATHVPVEIIPLNLDFRGTTACSQTDAWRPTSRPRLCSLRPPSRPETRSSSTTTSGATSGRRSARSAPTTTCCSTRTHPPSRSTCPPPRDSRCSTPGPIATRLSSATTGSSASSRACSSRCTSARKRSRCSSPYNTYVTDQNPNDCLSFGWAAPSTSATTTQSSTTRTRTRSTPTRWPRTWTTEPIFTASLNIGSEVLSHETPRVGKRPVRLRRPRARSTDVLYEHHARLELAVLRRELSSARPPRGGRPSRGLASSSARRWAAPPRSTCSPTPSSCPGLHARAHRPRSTASTTWAASSGRIRTAAETAARRVSQPAEQAWRQRSGA